MIWILGGNWPIRKDLAISDGIIIIPFSLQKQKLDQLHSNHMGRKDVAPCKGVSILDQYEC